MPYNEKWVDSTKMVGQIFKYVIFLVHALNFEVYLGSNKLQFCDVFALLMLIQMCRIPRRA